MTETHASRSSEASRVIRAAPDALYTAFVDPDAFKNLPPALRPEDNDAGARISLEQLARGVERPSEIS